MRRDMAEKMALAEDGLMRPKEAGEFLGISQSTLYALMERGELAYCMIASARRIPKRVLLEYAAKHMRGGWKKASA